MFLCLALVLPTFGLLPVRKIVEHEASAVAVAQLAKIGRAGDDVVVRVV
jgi:hypothetical protein